MNQEDTIAAISTPLGCGGIGIVRISGGNAFEIASRIFRGRKSFSEIKSHTINYGKIVDPKSGAHLDEVLVSRMDAPNSFTREDMVEINCHGGIFILKRILELVLSEGARLAEPGEFTRRAFLSGRIDLSQAEAVIDLINSRTSESTKAALEQLEGRLSKQLKGIRDVLVGLLAHIAVAVDYPEHDIEEITGENVYSSLISLREKILEIIQSFEKGRIIREGVSVVIGGRPNVGKSSLLNELAGKSRAIVTEIPGTTRDIIEEYINIKGIPARITDTAGLRNTGDIVEKIGVEKAEKALEQADLCIIVLDASEGLTDEDKNIIDKVKDREMIVLLNKSDLPSAVSSAPIPEGTCVIRASMKEGYGVEELENEIAAIFLKEGAVSGDEILITNIRHKNLLEHAQRSIEDACSAYENGLPLDCMAVDIENSAGYIGQITGESVSDSVMTEIFSRFCVGK